MSWPGALIFSIKERRVGVKPPALPSQELNGRGRKKIDNQFCLDRSLRAMKMWQPQWSWSAARNSLCAPGDAFQVRFTHLQEASKAAQRPDLPGTFLGRCLYTQSTSRVGNRTCPTGETLGYLSLFQISVQRKRKKTQNKTDFVYICFS